MPFSEDEIDDIAIENERRKNPPKFEAGMDEGDDIGFGSFGGGDDPFGGGGSDPFGGDPFGGGGSDPFGSSSGDPFGGGSSFGDSFGGGANAGGFGGFGSNDSAQSPQKSTEDVLFDGAKVATVETFTFIKLAVTSYKSQTRLQWLSMYRYALFGGAGISVIAILLMVFGIRGLDILTGGLMTVAIGVVGFMYNVDKAEKEEDSGIDIGRSKQGSEGITEQTDSRQGFGGDLSNNEEQGFGSTGAFGGGAFGDDPFTDTSTNPFDTDTTDNPFGETTTDTNPFGEVSDNPFGVDDSEFNIAPSKTAKKKDLEDEDSGKTRQELLDERIASINETKTLTRSYLYENFYDILENISPDYADVREVEDDDRDFRHWSLVVKKSAELFAPKNTDSDDMPYLISLEERLFYYYLVIDRVKWLKDTDKFVDEIVKFYAFDDKKGEMDTNVYGKGIASGDKIYVKIMRSEKIMISLKDIYNNNKKAIKDTKNKMPVVIGVTEEGEAVIEDFLSVNSILVAGEPRSGKSYLAKSLLIQMTAYNSPSEIQFYLYDRKGGTSDFLRMDMPHVREFEHEDAKIVAALRALIDREDKKRSALFEKAGVINITDYNKKNPDVKLPYVYVFIDEVVSLVDDMTQDLKKEFQSLLSQLITRLPNLGVRLFMIPHVVRDDVIKKRTTMMIPCRISVRGSEEHIQSTTGATYKEFPYKLKNVGDLSVKLTNDVPRFVKANVIAREEEGYQEVIDFLRKMWLKLEPESLEGSYYQKKLQKEAGVTTKDTRKNNIEIIPPTTSKPVNEDNNVLSSKEQDDLLDELWNGM